MRSYDYPAKNRVREAWMRFLPEFFTDANTRGLYLPSCENLELPFYKKKRLRTEQLIGAEIDPEKVDVVTRGAGGVQMIHGDVRDVVRHIEQVGSPRLRFVNLDFEGLYSRLIGEILSLFRVFPSRSGGYVCVTSFSSRDEETLEQGMIHTSKFYSSQSVRGEFLSDYGRMAHRYTKLKRMLCDSRTPVYSHLTRELGFLWWMTLVMGVVSYKDGAYGVLDHVYLTKLGVILDRIQAQVEALHQDKDDFHLVNEPELSDLMRTKMCELWPARFQHYMYYTQQGKPMHVWMLKIDFVKTEKKPSHQDVLEQVWQFATRSPLVYVDKAGNTHTLM